MGSAARTSPYILDDTDRSWDRKARCRGDRDPERFFRDEAASVEFCLGCPVRVKCLQWALDTDQSTGVWGGTTEDQRKALRLAAAAPVGTWKTCPKGLHEMTPERVTTGGECVPCKAIRNAEYREQDGRSRYECPTCHRRVTAKGGSTTLFAPHKDYSRDGAYCSQRAIPTEVQQ